MQEKGEVNWKRETNVLIYKTTVMRKSHIIIKFSSYDLAGKVEVWGSVWPQVSFSGIWKTSIQLHQKGAQQDLRVFKRSTFSWPTDNSRVCVESFEGLRVALLLVLSLFISAEMTTCVKGCRVAGISCSLAPVIWWVLIHTPSTIFHIKQDQQNDYLHPHRCWLIFYEWTKITDDILSLRFSH